MSVSVTSVLVCNRVSCPGKNGKTTPTDVGVCSVFVWNDDVSTFNIVVNKFEVVAIQQPFNNRTPYRYTKHSWWCLCDDLWVYGTGKTTSCYHTDVTIKLCSVCSVVCIQRSTFRWHSDEGLPRWISQSQGHGWRRHHLQRFAYPRQCTYIVEIRCQVWTELQQVDRAAAGQRNFSNFPITTDVQSSKSHTQQSSLLIRQSSLKY